MAGSMARGRAGTSAGVGLGQGWAMDWAWYVLGVGSFYEVWTFYGVG